MNTLGGSNEPVLREFPIVVAKDCAHWIRNDRKFTNEELSQGELSAALVMFDYVLEACAQTDPVGHQRDLSRLYEALGQSLEGRTVQNYDEKPFKDQAFGFSQNRNRKGGGDPGKSFL